MALGVVIETKRPEPDWIEEENGMKRFFFFGGKNKRKEKNNGVPETDAETGTTSSEEENSWTVNVAGAGSNPIGHESATMGEEPSARAENTPAPAVRGLSPGSDGEHRLQQQYGSQERAHAFYTRQVLDYLAPVMREFIARQEFLFVATADRHGECDCTAKFGRPGFIRVLDDKYLLYPEYRGNGVFANLGNITENPHIAMFIVDFFRDTVGLHVNGKARIVENGELLQHRDHLPDDVIEEIHQEGKKQPERWVMVEVEEAYIQCSKHIPLLKKLDKRIDWGTDNVVAKGGDYFRLQEIPLYDRVGGDKAMEKVVNVFYGKLLQDELVGKLFKDVDREAQRLKQKSFIAMAFGGPYSSSAQDLQEVRQLGLTNVHFDRLLAIFRETVLELHVPDPEVTKMCEILQTFRDDVLNR